MNLSIPIIAGFRQMTTRERRDFEAAGILIKIEYAQNSITVCLDLMKKNPETRYLFAVILRNDIVALNQLLREYRELFKRPLNSFKK